MSSLTVALAALGGVVLAGVVAHGAWQARKAGPTRTMQPAPDTEPRTEPRIDPVSEPREPVMGDVFAAGTVLAEPSLEPRLPRRAVARLDALIDAIATLTVEAPLSGELVIAQLPPSRRAGSKPFLIEGLNAETGEWEAPTPGQHYGELQAGVLLANRSGALNEIEYSEFVQKVQGFAEAIGAMTDFPDMLDVVARARELDAFASQHDAQLALHLRALAAAWSVGYIEQHAARQGFVAGAVPGRLVLPEPDQLGPPLLSLSYDSQAALADDANRVGVRDLTLNFDVAQSDPAQHPFSKWQASAQALAVAMEAEVVDDNGQPLSEAGFATIGAELSRLYAALGAHDLAAGSMAARRLFS